MTPRQRRIIGALVIVNGVIILALILFAARFSGSSSSPLLPTPVPTYPSGSLIAKECEQRALKSILDAGFGGTVAIAPGGSLRLNLIDTMAPGDSVDDLAQRVWTAFDVAIDLMDDRCDVASRVEVRLEPQSRGPLTRIYASVDATDLRAFYDGELSESEFIDRVQYEATSPNDQ